MYLFKIDISKSLIAGISVLESIHAFFTVVHGRLWPGCCAVTKKYKLACWIFEKSLKLTEFIMAYNFYADLKAAIENPSCAVSYFHTEKHFELSCSNRFRMRRLLRRVFKMATFCGAHVHTILRNSRAMLKKSSESFKIVLTWDSINIKTYPRQAFAAERRSSFNQNSFNRYLK